MAPGRRRKPGEFTTERSLTAAAMVLPIKSKSKLKRSVTTTAEWQRDALAYFDSTPELKHATWWVGNSLSKVRLYCAVMRNGEAIDIAAMHEVEVEGAAPRMESISGVDPAVVTQAYAELDRLGARSALQREIAQLIDLAGECYLVGWGKRDAVANVDPNKVVDAMPEKWDVRSVLEVEFKDGGQVKVAGMPGDKTGRTLDPELDTIIRFYQQHPTWSMLPDSHIRALLTRLRNLQTFEGQQFAESMSRHNAGILAVKKDTTWMSAKPSDPDDAQSAEDPFVGPLTDAITAPVADPSDPSSIVPNVALVDDVEKAFKMIDLSRGGESDSLDKRIDATIVRIANGLNVPVETVLGHLNTTFANAAQVSEDEFTDYLEPRVLLQCDLFTEGFLHPQLVEAKVDAKWLTGNDRVFVWYDASALLDAPDPADAADMAIDKFAISAKGYRAMKSIPEEYAPSPTELMQMIGARRGIFTADISLALLKLIDPTFEVVPIPDAPSPDAVPADAGDTQAAAETAQIISALGGPVVARLLLLQALGIQTPAIPAASIALSAGAGTPQQRAPDRPR